MNTLNLILQAAPAGAQNSSTMSILMMVLIFVVFYFFMIRPQTKKQKEIKKQRDAMKAGDQVVTAGGIYGKIKDVKEATVTIEIAENVRVKVARESVYAAVEDVPVAAK